VRKLRWPLSAPWRRGALFVSTLALVAGGLALDGGPQADAAGAPIVIGYMCTCTGPTASSNVVAPPAYQAWVDSVNATGGLNGHKVKLIVEDDQASPNVAISDVTTLINQDHVIALVDWSLVDGEWGPTALKAHIPIVGADPNGSLATTTPLFYSTGTTNEGSIAATLQSAKKGGGKLGVMYCAESPQCSEQLPDIKAQSSKYGVTVPYTTAISFSSPNYAAQCLEAKAEGVTSLSVADATLIVEHVASSCSTQGYEPYMVSGDGAVASTFTSAPLLKDKLLAYQPDIPFFVTNTPGTKAMNKAFNKYQPGLVSNPNYGETAVQSWVSGLLFAAAAKAGNLGANGAAPTSKALMNGIYALPKGTTLGGMTPPLTFKRGVSNSVKCWFWMGTKNGTFVVPSGSKTGCAS
jgi:branched-chain amino acid transport system substrate-binding protein